MNRQDNCNRLSDVLSLINDQGFKEMAKAIELLINEAMKLNGVKNPRVAAQALNPHAEFGTEEKNEIIPAIEEAKALGINADGPLPCDTSFITAFKNKNHDCIVGMYHDALQSGLKAFGFDRGVTVQGGLPVPITTPAHGTAFDIAGKNKANLEPTLNSFKIALTMAENKNRFNVMTFSELSRSKLADMAENSRHNYIRVPSLYSLARGIEQVRDNLA
jgi:4-hydroxy-L-threonine phosphate dehydrogenase PdxA